MVPLVEFDLPADVALVLDVALVVEAVVAFELVGVPEVCVELLRIEITAATLPCAVNVSPVAVVF